MEWIKASGFLIGGLTLLILGGEALVRASVYLAFRTKLTPAFVALTVVAFGTSAPELFTSLIAAFQEKPDIAVGNIVGSNIFNILAILGVAAIIRTNSYSKTLIRLEWPFLLLATVAFIALGWDSIFSRLDGSIFLFALGAFLIISMRAARKSSREDNEEIDIDISKSKGPAFDVILLFVGFVLLLGGAHTALEGAVAMGKLAGLSERIIGLTIVSVGTGLPELATSAVAAFRGRNDIAVSNIIGSNIMNTLLITGTTATIYPIAVSRQILMSDVWWMLGATLILAVTFIGKEPKLTRVHGVFLLLLYFGFLASLATR